MCLPPELFNSNDKSEGGVVELQDAQKYTDVKRKQRSIGSLVTWLLVSMVGMLVIYLLFNAALTSY